MGWPTILILQHVSSTNRNLYWETQPPRGLSGYPPLLSRRLVYPLESKVLSKVRIILENSSNIVAFAPVCVSNLWFPGRGVDHLTMIF